MLTPVHAPLLGNLLGLVVELEDGLAVALDRLGDVLALLGLKSWWVVGWWWVGVGREGGGGGGGAAGSRQVQAGGGRAATV